MSRQLFERAFKSPLAKGFWVTLLGSGASKVILMLATFVFTHLLSKEDFGSFSFIRNTLNIILCICALNYVGLVTKYTAEIEYKEESRIRVVLVFLFSLAICLILGLGLVALPEDTLAGIIGEPSFAGYFRAVGLLLPIFMLQPLIEGVLRGVKLFKLIGILQTVTACLFVGFVVMGSLMFGVNGAVTGLLLYYIAYTIISVFVLLKRTSLFASFKNIRLPQLKEEAIVIWTMILPVFVLSFVEAPINWWAQVLMVKYDTIGAVGSMSAILQIRNLLIIVPNYFFSTFTTFQATLNASGNQTKYFSNLTKVFWGCLLAGIVATVILSLCGSFLLGLYGDLYKADIDAFYVAMLAFPMMITISLMKSSLLIKEHQQLMLVASVMSSIAQICIMYVLLPQGGNPVLAYFWGQMMYCTVTFFICGLCCIYDKKMSK